MNSILPALYLAPEMKLKFLISPMLFIVSSMPKHMPYAIVISQAFTFENPTSQHSLLVNVQEAQSQRNRPNFAASIHTSDKPPKMHNATATGRNKATDIMDTARCQERAAPFIHPTS